MRKVAGAVGTSIFLVSFALIALQLFYMRALSVIRYHHFSYLVISTALLGFGVSGTYLTFTYHKISQHFQASSRRVLLAFSASIPISYTLVKELPIDIRYLLYSVEQVLILIVYNLLVLLPFFFGAVFIGMCLRYYRNSIPVLYGVNLFGSGLGGLGALWVMHLLPAETLPLTPAVAGVLAQVVWAAGAPPSPGGRGRRIAERPAGWLAAAAGLLCALAGFALPVESGIDQYKSLAHIRRLERQGDAEHIYTEYSPRMRLDLYEAPSLHQTLFAGPMAETAPPPQLTVLFDGQVSGTLFRIDSAAEAAILDSTPQSLPYRLLRDRGSAGRALLLGEVGGTNVWMAKRFGIRNVSVLQPAEILLRSFRRELRGKGGDVFFSEGVETIARPARLYLERAGQNYDIIHIASAEGMPAGSSGLQSLHENYLLTREGIAACLERLRQNGFVAITRGIQSPPRDNIKVCAMFLEALKLAGVEQPQRHLLQARNYLAATTLVSMTPIDAGLVQRFRAECRELGMDVEYFPGIRSSEIEQQNQIQGPPGKRYSYYHHAALQLLSGKAEEFYGSWAYNVRPPTDQQPYFHNFFKWRSYELFVDAYGGGFLRRMDLGYVVLVLTFIEICAVAFVLILLPLWLGRLRKSPQKAPEEVSRGTGLYGRRLPVFLHFGGIGFGFMFLEMVMIQKLAHFLGDPIYSASAVITSILVCAGIGSSLQDRLPRPARQRIRGAAALVVLLAAGSTLFMDPLLDLFIEYSTLIRFSVALLILAPLAFFMGWMLPSGMQMIRDEAPDLIPWAWGINGFASVAAGPLAVILSIAIGFPGVILCAAGCYATAGAAAWLWPE
ncbi:MAG: hypothetical protein ACOCXF_00925 [bacterium]